MSLTVIIPAHNEAANIGDCLDALCGSRGPQNAEVLVVANGCVDDTVSIAQSYEADFDYLGWRLRVLETSLSGKLGALNMGDAAASYDTRVYLDADVKVSKGLLKALADVLTRPTATYASGTLIIKEPRKFTSKAYARVWRQVPFMRSGVPGAGLFAVNQAGRARWDDWPDIISDDSFARLHFAPSERVGVPEQYEWPIVEGLRNLVSVRRRQNRGVAQLAEQYPALLKNAEHRPLGGAQATKIALGDPVGMAIYGGVGAFVRLTRRVGGTEWRRGR